MNASDLSIVIGLGNPGREYAGTRHNMGFLVVEELARRHGLGGSRRRFRAEIAEGRAPWGKLVLAQPQTYMNESGHAARELVQWYRQPLDRLLVVVDDLDLPFGQLRLRANGSAGGHNGLKSIFAQLGTDAVPRLRVGIGRDERVARARVLSRFSAEEKKQLGETVRRVADIVDLWGERGIVEAMNVANVRPKPAKSASTPEGEPPSAPASHDAHRATERGKSTLAPAASGGRLRLLLRSPHRQGNDDG